MTDAPIETKLMTIEEFVQLYVREGPFELIDGERIPVMPTVARHVVTTKTVFIALHNFVSANQLGEVFSEGPFVMLYQSNWVKGSRVPDVMFYSAARLAEYKAQTPDWEDKPWVLIPDLVVEVLSPGDSYDEVDAKVDRYLQDGVKLIWVINPQRRKVIVHVAGSSQQTTLSINETLGGGDVLPGFQLAVRDIFPQ